VPYPGLLQQSVRGSHRPASGYFGGLTNAGGAFQWEPDRRSNVQPRKTGKGIPTMKSEQAALGRVLLAAATALAVIATATPAAAEELRGPLGYIPGVEDIPGNPGAFGNYLGIPDAGSSWRVSGSKPLTAGVYAVGVPPVSEDTWTGMVVIDPQPRADLPWVAVEPAHADFDTCVTRGGYPRAVKARDAGKAFVRLPDRLVQRCAASTGVETIATAGLIVGLREGQFASWRDVPFDVLTEFSRLLFHGFGPSVHINPALAWIRDDYRADIDAHNSQPHIQAARQAAHDAVAAEWAMKGIEWKRQCNTDPLDNEQWKACSTAWFHGGGSEGRVAANEAGRDAAVAAGVTNHLEGWPTIPEYDAYEQLFGN